MSSIRVTLPEAEAALAVEALRRHAEHLRTEGVVIYSDLLDSVCSEEYVALELLDGGLDVVRAHAAALDRLADRIDERRLAC